MVLLQGKQKKSAMAISANAVCFGLQPGVGC